MTLPLAGKYAVITGASQGLGLAIAKAYVLAGANVMICARNKKKLADAHAELRALAKPDIQILAQTTDVTQPAEITALITTCLNAFGKIDILVANAGIYGPKGCVEEVDWDLWCETIAINLKGVVLACRAVLPMMKKNLAGQIIILSGGGATKPLPYLSAYAASKAAVVRFAETLAHEVSEFNINVNAVAPGALNTRLLDEIITAGENQVGTAYYQQALDQKSTGGIPLSLPAKLCVFLAAQPKCNITGKLISAVWDPWEKLIDYSADLLDSDIYTLRRILPSERGKTWDKTS